MRKQFNSIANTASGNGRWASHRWIAGAAVLAFAFATTATQASENPGYDRPGLGFTPATLDAGDIAWEQGLPDWSETDEARQYTADTLLRLGMGHGLEVQLGSSYNRLSAGGETEWGRGGTSLGLKFAPKAPGPLSWGVLGSVTFTDGEQPFRSEDEQYLLGVALNWQLDARNAVGAYLENIYSDGDNDHLVAINAGRALSDSLGAYVEAAWLHSDDEDGSTAGAGLTWQTTPALQLDASFRHRLGGEAPTWEAGFGVSVFFDRP